MNDEERVLFKFGAVFFSKKKGFFFGRRPCRPKADRRPKADEEAEGRPHLAEGQMGRQVLARRSPVCGSESEMRPIYNSWYEQKTDNLWKNQTILIFNLH